MRTESITSAQNPKIRLLLELQEKSGARRKNAMFPVEGRREIRHCIEAGYRLRTVFYCPDIISGSELDSILGSCADDLTLISVTAGVYDRIACRKGTEGIIAEVEMKPAGLDGIRLGENPLIVVLESVEKPGNLGAVLRSADAANADAVIICDPLTDLFNPNLIRASLGAVFTVPTAVASSEETIAWLKAGGIRILTAQLQDSEWYYDTDMTCGTALVMGTESEGLTDLWRRCADAHIRIPMLGALDSLNVSVSAAILMFEAVRQRNTNK